MKRNSALTEADKFNREKKVFETFNSPLNLLSRNAQSNYLSAESNKLFHYAGSQISFAHHSMQSLINLHNKFRARDMFNPYSNGINDVEMKRMENLYRAIAEERENIAESTALSHQKILEIRSAKSRFPYINMQNRSDAEWAIVNLRYNESSEMLRTRTSFYNNSRYSRYTDPERKSKFGTLYLDYITKMLGDDVYQRQDRDIILGEIAEEGEGKNKRVIHRMGIYRDVVVEKESASFVAERVKRVDEITALTAKKALTTKDKTQAMEHAFLFTVLRGYNVRSVIGACWAQEMSLRWIMAQNNWPQFRKTPGLYLDVEAAMLGQENCADNFRNLIKKEVRDYMISTRVIVPPLSYIAKSAAEFIGIIPHEKSLFKKPLLREDDDFTRYLIETRKYRAQDLPQIISYQSRDDDGHIETAFHIAAKSGDRKLFELIESEAKSDAAFKSQIMRQQLVWSEIEQCAKKYGEDEFVEIVRDFYGVLFGKNLREAEEKKDEDDHQIVVRSASSLSRSSDKDQSILSR